MTLLQAGHCWLLDVAIKEDCAKGNAIHASLLVMLICASAAKG